jgi:hypothetical protein
MKIMAWVILPQGSSCSTISPPYHLPNVVDVQNLHNVKTLSAADIFAINQKIVDAISIESTLDDAVDIDNASVAQLESIAAQCPIIGGPAVYTAREKVYKYNKKIYNDHDICAQQGISFRVVKPKKDEKVISNNSKIKIYPNPSNIFVILERESDAENDTEISVTNALGMLIGTSHWSKLQKQFIIATEQYASGMYFCTIREQSGTVSQYKINIIH